MDDGANLDRGEGLITAKSRYDGVQAGRCFHRHAPNRQMRSVLEGAEPDDSVVLQMGQIRKVLEKSHDHWY